MTFPVVVVPGSSFVFTALHECLKLVEYDYVGRLCLTIDYLDVLSLRTLSL